MQKLPVLRQDQILKVECLLFKIAQVEKNNNQTEIQQLCQQLEAIYQSVLPAE